MALLLAHARAWWVRLRLLWAKLRGRDERALEAERRLEEALSTDVDLANAAVDEAVQRAVRQAKRVATMTPPPRPRPATLPSIPEEP